jgi:hypothetical protein
MPESLLVLSTRAPTTQPSLPTRSYHAGQYAFICVPEISRFEWHPLSLSSSPDAPVTQLHCRASGDWTQKVFDLAGMEKKKIFFSLLLCFSLFARKFSLHTCWKPLPPVFRFVFHGPENLLANISKTSITYLSCVQASRTASWSRSSSTVRMASRW